MKVLTVSFTHMTSPLLPRMDPISRPLTHMYANNLRMIGALLRNSGPGKRELVCQFHPTGFWAFVHTCDFVFTIYNKTYFENFYFVLLIFKLS